MRRTHTLCTALKGKNVYFSNGEKARLMWIPPGPRNYNCSIRWLPSCLSGKCSAISTTLQFTLQDIFPSLLLCTIFFSVTSLPWFFVFCFLPTPITFLMVRLMVFSLERSTVGSLALSFRVSIEPTKIWQEIFDNPLIFAIEFCRI